MREVAAQRLDLKGVLPVLSFADVNEVEQVCALLYECGFRWFEITLRSDTAIAQLASVLRLLPKEARVGAGTIRTLDQLKQVQDCGGTFGISPGLIPAVADEAIRSGWPYMPAVATVSETYQAQEMGFTQLKLFPAQQIGGPGFLKAVAPVTEGISFCPTGGVTASNLTSYLEQPNVFAVGGSWIVARDEAGRVLEEETKQRATEALSLSGR